MSERKEAILRILIGIVSGIILAVWRSLIQILIVFHLLYVLVIGERMKEVAEFCEIWNTQLYTFVRYITFVTNERPWPFAKLYKNKSKFK